MCGKAGGPRGLSLGLMAEALLGGLYDSDGGAAGLGRRPLLWKPDVFKRSDGTTEGTWRPMCTLVSAGRRPGDSLGERRAP